MNARDSTEVNNNQKNDNYYIVEFEDGLQMIPQNWLISDKQTFWPPFHDWKKYYNAVKNMHEPAHDWKTSTIVKIIGSVGTFSRAREKLSMAENTSDISTDTDPNVTKLKRRRRARKILSEEDSSEDSVCDTFSEKRLPFFPVPPQARNDKNTNNALSSSSQRNTDTQKIKVEKSKLKKSGNIAGSQKIINATKNETYDSDLNRSESENEISQLVQHCSKDSGYDKLHSEKRSSLVPVPSQARNDKNGNNASSSSLQWNIDTRNIQKMRAEKSKLKNSGNIAESQKITNVTEIDNEIYDSDLNRSENENEISPIQHSSKVLREQNRQRRIDVSPYVTHKQSKCDTCSEKHCNSCKDILNYQQQMLQLLVENNLREKKCERMLQKLMEKMNENKNVTSISDLINIDDLYPEYLPAQTLADFHAAEEKLKTNKKYRNDVLELFVKCKSNDLKHTIYTIMGKLMLNNVAMLYSWTGAKQNKEKFENSPFRNILENIIIQLHSDATLQGMKKCITDWLRHAKERNLRHSNNDNEQCQTIYEKYISWSK